jgi:hypothetical protein
VSVLRLRDAVADNVHEELCACESVTAKEKSMSSRVQQSWVKTIAVIANPNPEGGINPLRISKSGFAPGLGQWRLFMLSDAVCSHFLARPHADMITRQFSVGGYVIPRLEISHSAAGLTIHAIHIHINQTFSLISPDEYQFSACGYDESATETRCPTEKLVVFLDGKVPAKGVKGASAKDAKDRTTAPLWAGRQQSDISAKDDEEVFVWQQDKLRLPDETKLRPTSLPG